MQGLLELDRIGKLIAGKYRLELVLGRGGMGTVYRATHAWTGRPVAVKYLHPDHAQDAASVARFLREARAAASVRHPNAVDVLDMGQDTDGSAYLVLELLEGGTLGQYIAANGRLSAEDAARLLVPVMEALDELHRVGVVHRDFKPANIFLARTPRGGMIPKLLDFGVAKMLDETAGLSTTTGIVVGTPAYMAPEQAAGLGDVGPWTDIWAVGAVLYECLVGELPFAAPTPSLLLVNVMTKTAPPLCEKRPDLSPAVCVVVDRALSKEHAQRFQTAAAMAEALREATGLLGGSETGPIAAGVLASSKTGPAPASGVRLQEAAMAAAPDAPTVAVKRSSSEAAVPLAALGPVQSPAAEPEKLAEGERKNWTGPSATGRLHSPATSRARTWMGVGALALLGLGVGFWLTEGMAPQSETPTTSSESVENAALPAPATVIVPPAEKAVDPTVVGQPVAAPGVGAGASAEPDAGAALAQPPVAPNLEPERAIVDPLPPSTPSRRRSRGARETAKPTANIESPPAPEPSRSGAPPAAPDVRSPPRVEREW